MSYGAGRQSHHSAGVKLTQILFDANEKVMQINASARVCVWERESVKQMRGRVNYWSPY